MPVLCVLVKYGCFLLAPKLPFGVVTTFGRVQYFFKDFFGSFIALNSEVRFLLEVSHHFDVLKLELRFLLVDFGHPFVGEEVH